MKRPDQSQEREPTPVPAAMASRVRFVRIGKFAELTGYTAKAAYHKIAEGVWVERRQYWRAPDGNICIDLDGYEAWGVGERALVSSR